LIIKFTLGICFIQIIILCCYVVSVPGEFCVVEMNICWDCEHGVRSVKAMEEKTKWNKWINNKY